jgi:transposase-like protein
MSLNSQRIEVITGVQRRRRFPDEHKLRLIEEANRQGMSVS